MLDANYRASSISITIIYKGALRHNYTYTHLPHKYTGGITSLAIDRDALDEYSRATGSDSNLDEFMARLTGNDVIPKEVRERCSIEVTLVRNTTEVSRT